MSRFLPNFGTKAGPPPAAPPGVVARAVPVSNWQVDRPYSPPTVASDVPRFVRDTYERVTWVYAAVRAVAHNSARLTVRMLDEPDLLKGKDVPGDHPLLPLLNFMPNDYSTAYWWRWMLSAQIELSSKGAFVEIVRSNRGDPLSLHLLPPQNVFVLPDARTFIGGYEVRTGNGYETTTLPPEDVLWFRNPHPLDPYRSMTAFEAAGMAVDADWLSHVYNANFMRNDGRGAGLIAAKGGLNQDDADELSSWMRGGVNRAGQWRVVDADGLEVVDMSQTARDSQYVETRALAKEEILIGAGVPESSAGNASGRTWDNADVEQWVLWDGKLNGHLRLVGGVFDTLDKDPTTYTTFDTSGIEVLQRVRNAERTQRLAEFKAGLVTVDEFRDEFGYDPFDVPQTTVPLTTVGTTPLFKVDDKGNVVEDPPPAPPPLQNARPDVLGIVPTPNGNGAEPEPQPAQA